MSDASTPIWRQALNDSDHPLNRAAWLIFSQKFNVDYAVKQLEPQKDAVIAFLLTILDDEPLYLKSSLGEGVAPVHAVRLIERWEVAEAAPRLVQIIRDSEWGDVVLDAALFALGKIGKPVVELVLPWTEEDDEEILYKAAAILADVAQGDPRAFAFLEGRFQAAVRSGDEMDIEVEATHMLEADTERALPLVEALLAKPKKLTPRLQKILPELIRDFRDKLSGAL